MKERDKPISIKEILRRGKELGGSEIEIWDEYELNENVPYYDKGGHRERSIANQPNHLKFWRSRNNKP